MRLVRTALVVALHPELATSIAVQGAMSACASARNPIAPASPSGCRRGSFTALVILAFAYLLCLAPLLHAHPANDAGPRALPDEAHPVGIHLPEQTRAPAFLAVDEDTPAPAVTIDARALTTIVVAESYRRDGSPTPHHAKPSAADAPRIAASASPKAGFAWPPNATTSSADAGWPAYLSQAPPASA